MNNREYLHNIDKTIACILVHRLTDKDMRKLQAIADELDISIYAGFIHIENVDKNAGRLLKKLQIRANRNPKQILKDLFTKWKER